MALAHGKQQAIVPPPPIHQLAIEKAFNALSQQDQLYAHHLSRCVMNLSKPDLISNTVKVQHGMGRE